MPVEIRELIIRAYVDSGNNASNDPEDTETPDTGTAEATDMDAIVEEAVRQVLRILERERER